MSLNSTILKNLSKKWTVFGFTLILAGVSSVSAKPDKKLNSPLVKSVRLHMWDYGLTEINDNVEDKVSQNSSGRIKLSHELRQALSKEKKMHLLNDDNEG